MCEPLKFKSLKDRSQGPALSFLPYDKGTVLKKISKIQKELMRKEGTP